MELRYQLALVTGGGAGPGPELVVGLARAGCAVLVVDPDLAAAEASVAQAELARVKAWALQAEVPQDLDLVAARAADLGGADLLVDCAGRGWPAALVGAFADGLAERRGRRDGVPGVVHVCAGPGCRPVPDPRLRAMTVADPGPTLVRRVVDLLARGPDGALLTTPVAGRRVTAVR